ncbi:MULTISPECIES: phage portal protein [unclassified Actinotignum]|uniref:phage portal protein n=1 Tax=unclassified Actinotignum TaxID=2632702 RepID=UPI002A800FD0|nr:phage portal protein [Actinotignum sp. SLA_B059]MDY5127459.1 phage portal protein [Actinotignum sp. SLA_B059]
MNNPLARMAHGLGLLTRSDDTGGDDAPSPVIIPPARTRTTGDPRSLAAVYRALFILETASRQLTLDAWRGDELIKEPPAIVRRPSLEMHRPAFISETVNSLAQRGNAYWKISRSGYEVIDARILNPVEVAVWRDERSDTLRYSWRGKRIPARDIIHLKLTHVPGEIYGMGPIQACAQTVRGAQDMRAYADNWTGASGRPTGILSTDQRLTEEQATIWKKQANEMLTPGHGVGVFGQGMTYKPLLLNPSELQFLESQRENTTEIARMFGIPARLMLASIEGGSQTYANAQQEDIAFLRYTLIAYLNEIESAFTEITPRGTTVKFNVDGLLRTDTKTRYEAHAIGLNAGFLTPEEVRAIEGLPATKAPAEIMEESSI